MWRWYLMYQFIYWIKVIAAIFITNSHYSNIWPVSAMACGGNLGNCLYFFVSGFCLYHIKDSLPKWYLKRMTRIYPSLWISAVMYLLIGWWHIDGIQAAIRYLIYPTWFHFIGTIMLLYVLFYVWRKMCIGGGTLAWMAVVAVVFGIAYIALFDKTYYHIDSVEEKWVRFQFAEAMLMGALFREKYETIDCKIRKRDVVRVMVMLVTYFASMLIFKKVKSASVFQIINPFVLLLLIFSIAVLAVKLEKSGYFAVINSKIDKIVRFLASITLEIYLVQFPIVAAWSKFRFPLNFVVVTATILVCAWAVHWLSEWLRMRSKQVLKKNIHRS